MASTTQKLGWIGVGRMGGPMAERLLAAGHSLAIWNRTRAKADPFAKHGARVVERLAELSDVDVLFTMVSEGKDLEEVYFRPDGVVTNSKGRLPKTFVDCSSISVEELDAHPGPSQRAWRAIRGVSSIGKRSGNQGREAFGRSVRSRKSGERRYSTYQSVRTEGRFLRWGRRISSGL